MEMSSQIRADRICFLALISLVASLAQGADEPIWRRWAVVSDAVVQDSGVSDLLAAALSHRPEIELVERDQIALAVKELEHTALAGAADVGRRLQLGRTLRADGLILLSEIERADARCLQIILCDCRYGARLAVATLSWPALSKPQSGVPGDAPPNAEPPADPRPELADKAAALVDKVLTRYPRGVLQVVTVTPLLSRNLIHDYDYLQTGFARVLEASIIDMPGVAVLEIEESHAIGQELTIDGADLAERRVPLVVEGEFSVAAAKNGQDPEAKVLLRLLRSRQVVRQLPAATAALTDVPKMLLKSLAAAVAEEVESDVPALSIAEEFAALCNRANVFANQGAWSQSCDLREAALLLAPDDLPTTLELVADYSHDQCVAPTGVYREIDKKTNQPTAAARAAWNKLHARRMVRWRRMAWHVERLIERRQLNPFEARYLIDVLFLLMRGVADVSDRQHELLRVYQYFPKLDCELNGGYVRPAVAHSYWQYPPPPSPVRPPGKEISRAIQYDGWVSGALRNVLQAALSERNARPPEGHHTGTLYTYPQQTFDELFWILTEVADPDGPPVVGMEELTFNEHHSLVVETTQYEQLQKLYDRLEQTHRPANDFYAQCGRLALEAWGFAPDRIDKETITRVDALQKVFDQRGFGKPSPELYERFGDGPNRYSGSLYRLRVHIIRNVPELTQAALGPPPTTKWHFPPPTRTEPYDPDARVTFTRIEGLTAQWGDWLRVDAATDILWGPEAVYVMREKGSPRQIFSTGDQEEKFFNKDWIQSLAWDGEIIWISRQRSGVVALSLDGEVLARIGKDEGLPPYEPPGSAGLRTRVDSSLLLHAVEPGKCMIIGRHGQQRRWFAVAQRGSEPDEKGKFRTKVFHTATKEAGPNGESLHADTECMFEVGWLLEYSNPDLQIARSLLVGRMATFGIGNYAVEFAPLAIDLKTLEVKLFPARLKPARWTGPLPPDAEGRDFTACSNRLLLARPEGYIEQFTLPGGEATNQWLGEPLCAPTEPAGNRWGFVRHVPRFLKDGDHTYFPGQTWYRIRNSDVDCELLTKTPLPVSLTFINYAVSAHYGLVAWNDKCYSWGNHYRSGLPGEVFQVRIDGGPQDPALHYGDLAPEERAKHLRAEAAIRRLEGRLTISPHPLQSSVVLDNAWKGDEEDLRLLADLSNLTNVTLYQTPVANHGLRHIARLPNLTGLVLCETRVTDDGLGEFANHTKLRSLWIEGTLGGNEFSDAGLAHLKNCASLEWLTLYGRGFTDPGLENLKAIKALGFLKVLETAITERGVRTLKGSVPNLNWQINPR